MTCGHCEILRLCRNVKWNLPTSALANISHLRSKYFTAELFHLPVRANFVEKKHPLSGRQRVFLFWRKRWDSNPRALSDNRISSAARYDHFDTLPHCRLLTTFHIISYLFKKVNSKEASHAAKVLKSLVWKSSRGISGRHSDWSGQSEGFTMQ